MGINKDVSSLSEKGYFPGTREHDNPGVTHRPITMVHLPSLGLSNSSGVKNTRVQALRSQLYTSKGAKVTDSF